MPGGIGSGGAGGSGNSGNAGSSSASGGSGNVGAGGETWNLGGSNTNAPDAGCVSEPYQAEQVTKTETRIEIVTTYSPLDMYIMYDQSGSMGGDRWDAIKAALTGFVNAPGSADMGVGIQYFPLAAPACQYGDPGCNCILCPGFLCVCFNDSGGSCTVADYATPDVPIGLLPAVAPAIVNSLNAHGPGGGTPTRPALEGAHQYAAQWAVDHPDRKTIVVLATDGNPSDTCDPNTVQDCANVAAAALAATPSVPTFVIGVGGSLTSLHAIAAAGGSDQAIIVDDSSGDPTQQFIDALNAIRDQVTTEQQVEVPVTETVPVPCEWVIPEMPEGITFDRDKVNIEFKAGASGAPQLIGAVRTEADCANVEGGWHYDNYDNPTKVLVCDQTCTTIQAVQDAYVNVVFGCETKPAPPR